MTRKKGKPRKKKGMGYLYKVAYGNSRQYPPDSTVAGTYWLRRTVAGKQMAFPLLDEHGLPIKNRDEAEAAQIRQAAPYFAKDKLQKLKTLATEIRSTETDMLEAETTAAPGVVIAKAWQAFMTSTSRPDASPATLQQYAFQFKRFAKWMESKHKDKPKMRDVSETIADEYAADLQAAGLTANTYNKHLNLLKLVWRVLEKQANAPADPWKHMKRKREIPEGRRELTVQELKDVCAGLDGEMRILFAVGIYTGMRLGDAVLLKWGEVDLSRNLIRKTARKTARKKNSEMLKIPLHPVLQSILAETPASRRRGDVMPELSAIYRRDKSAVTKRIQKKFAACKIETQDADKTGRQRPAVRVGYHSLRHTFVSLCREANAPLVVVESLVGHSNPAMTRLYSHVSDTAAQAAIAALPAVTGDTMRAPAPVRAPLPPWVDELLETMTEKNWKAVRRKIRKRAAK